MLFGFSDDNGCIFVRDVQHAPEEGKEKINLWQDLQESLHNKGLLYVMTMFFLIQVCTMIIQPLVTMYVSHLMGRMDESVVKAAGIIFHWLVLPGSLLLRFGANAVSSLAIRKYYALC